MANEAHEGDLVDLDMQEPKVGDLLLDDRVRTKSDSSSYSGYIRAGSAVLGGAAIGVGTVYLITSDFSNIGGICTKLGYALYEAAPVVTAMSATAIVAIKNSNISKGTAALYGVIGGVSGVWVAANSLPGFDVSITSSITDVCHSAAPAFSKVLSAGITANLLAAVMPTFSIFGRSTTKPQNPELERLGLSPRAQ